MPEINRARQFMPFAALKGYDKMIKERTVVHEPKRALSEDRMEMLSKKLCSLKRGTMINAEFFCGNGYTNIEGLVANVDTVFRTLTIVRTKIRFDDLWDIEERNT